MKKVRNVSPRTRANAFRIWRVANEVGWDLCAAEAARRAGVKLQELNAVLQLLHPSWSSRFRAPDAPRGLGAVRSPDAVGNLPHIYELEFMNGA